MSRILITTASAGWGLTASSPPLVETERLAPVATAARPPRPHYTLPRAWPWHRTAAFMFRILVTTAFAGSGRTASSPLSPETERLASVATAAGPYRQH